MKIKIILLLIITVTCLFTANAQNAEIDSIKQVYREAQSYIKEAEDYHGEKTQIEFKRMIPALGNVRTIINFYGNEELLTDEALTYPWENDGNRNLNLVTVLVNCNCTADAYIEYLFDPKTQELIFFYKRIPEDNLEYRFYFNENKLIRLQENSITSKETEERFPNIKSSNFTIEELKRANKHINTAKDYINMFDNLYSFEKIEKRGE